MTDEGNCLKGLMGPPLKGRKTAALFFIPLCGEITASEEHPGERTVA